MTIEELFALGENGVLSYENFTEFAKQNGMKLVNLADGGYVSKKKYEDDLAAKNTEVENLNGTISQRDVDLQAIKAQLEAAGTDATKLNELNESFTALQSKYDNDVKAYKAQLAKQAYEFAVKDFANTKKFTSNAAKRDFISSMLAKDLKMDNGKILGAEDFAVAYSTDNSDAFMVETPVTTPEPPKPQFVAPTTPENPAPKTLTEMMKLKNDNPEAIIGF